MDGYSEQVTPTWIFRVNQNSSKVSVLVCVTSFGKIEAFNISFMASSNSSQEHVSLASVRQQLQILGYDVPDSIILAFLRDPEFTASQLASRADATSLPSDLSSSGIEGTKSDTRSDFGVAHKPLLRTKYSAAYHSGTSTEASSLYLVSPNLEAFALISTF